MSATPNKPTFWQVLRSVAASMFGVQSHKNYEQDFQQTSVVPYVIVGVIFVVLLVVSLAAFVNILT